MFEGRPGGTAAWGGAGSIAHQGNSMGEDSEARKPLARVDEQGAGVSPEEGKR